MMTGLNPDSLAHCKAMTDYSQACSLRLGDIFELTIHSNLSRASADEDGLPRVLSAPALRPWWEQPERLGSGRKAVQRERHSRHRTDDRYPFFEGEPVWEL